MMYDVVFHPFVALLVVGYFVPFAALAGWRLGGRRLLDERSMKTVGILVFDDAEELT